MKKLLNYLNKLKTKTDGFTIVELMIATTVFTVILVMTIFVIISFTHNYYKAVNSSTAQNSARTILNDVTQAIEFSSLPVAQVNAPHNENAYCIGTKDFNFNAYSLQNSSTSAIWESANPSPDSSCVYESASSGQDLLGSNLQILNFQICLLGFSPCSLVGASESPTYSIYLTVGYGRDALLCDTSSHTSCPQNGANTFNPPDSYTASNTYNCVENEGTEFCDVVNLTAVVQMRTAAD